MRVVVAGDQRPAVPRVGLADAFEAFLMPIKQAVDEKARAEQAAQQDLQDGEIVGDRRESGRCLQPGGQRAEVARQPLGATGISDRECAGTKSMIATPAVGSAWCKAGAMPAASAVRMQR